MVDITVLGALAAGVLSFISPCILPVVPFYLSYLAGVEIKQVNAGKKIKRRVIFRAFVAALSFSAGIIVVFVLLGASASKLGLMLRDHFGILRWIAAAIITIMGLQFLGVVRIDYLFRQLKLFTKVPQNYSLIGSFLLGFAFAFGWTPCVGPILATILFLAAAQETAFQGTVLLVAYGVGMTAPFIFASIFVFPFLRWLKGFKKYLSLVEKISGIFLLLFAVLVASNSLRLIAAWLLEQLPWLNSLG